MGQLHTRWRINSNYTVNIYYTVQVLNRMINSQKENSTRKKSYRKIRLNKHYYAEAIAD